jgi:hypothetical protein
MLLPANILGILCALTSAFVWGSGDFTGGYATRRSSQFHVLTLSALSGLLVVIAAAGAQPVRKNRPSMKMIATFIFPPPVGDAADRITGTRPEKFNVLTQLSQDYFIPFLYFSI